MNVGENQNIIVTFVEYENTKVFLTLDMIIKDDKALKDYLGKIDILNLPIMESLNHLMNFFQQQNQIMLL